MFRSRGRLQQSSVGLQELFACGRLASHWCVLLSSLCYRHKEQRCGFTLPWRQSPFIFLQPKPERAGRGNSLWAKSLVNTATAVFNLPKENMWFQNVIRDYCSHSKRILNTNCRLSFNRTPSWEASLILILQTATRAAGPASGSVFMEEGLLSLSMAPLSRISHHQCAPRGSG